MNKQIIAMFMLSMFALNISAQASGGQITRKPVNKTQTSPKKEVNRKNSSNQSESNSEQRYSTPPPPPNILPIPIDELPSYNVVVGTMGIIANAQRLCQSLRDQGYSSQLYYDENRIVYRIIIGSTNNETEALSLRDNSRQTYPDAWIMYIVNGKEYTYSPKKQIEMPKFPGGPSALLQYLSENVNYPEIAEKKGIQGRVEVVVIVENDGTIHDAWVGQSVNPDLDKEAIRVVKNMPKWIPGNDNGNPIRVKYTIPINFSLK